MLRLMMDVTLCVQAVIPEGDSMWHNANDFSPERAEGTLR